MLNTYIVLLLQTAVYSTIETLHSSLGDQPDLGSVAFILSTQTLYVHTTGCDIVSQRQVALSDINPLFSACSSQIPGPPGPEVRTCMYVCM